jgi:hypothetical protein
MNERIKELAEQAEAYVESQVKQSKGWSNDAIINLRRDKFTQLIIDECIQVAYAAEKKPEGFLTVKSARNLETEIYTHFGVKQ